ncbi:MAG TPA: cbb3-type cytochrome c oxidase subunit II [Myxococcaceae bacterium]|nr:cbb3-type cytochrome c oxidase subunit II [Myxococcaceae bacterium]
MHLELTARRLVTGSLAFVLLATVLLVVLPFIKLRHLEVPEGLHPYTDAQARGREEYIRQGCVYCHSQQPRDPSQAPDMKRGWGRPSVPADYSYDTPHQLGTMRTGPDLFNIGARQPSAAWHLGHLYQPRAYVPGSNMPSYPFLFEVKAEAAEGDTVVTVPPKFAPEAGVIVAKRAALDLVQYMIGLDHTYPAISPHPKQPAAGPMVLLSKDPAVLADIKAGTAIVRDGVPGSGVAACGGCHGPHGEGNAAVGGPRLAGQPDQYLQQQLAAYADGRRKDPIMVPVAKGLSKEQRGAVSVYLSRLSPPGAQPETPLDHAVEEKGARLAWSGDEALHVQACVNCHGVGGVGEPPRIPYLAGQSETFLKASLHAWKDGRRNTDASGQMTEIAKNLGEADIAALAAYYASQKPPLVTAASQPPKTVGRR